MIKVSHFSISKIFLAVFFGLIFTGLAFKFWLGNFTTKVVDETTRVEEFLEEAQTLWKNPSFKIPFSSMPSKLPICSDIPLLYTPDLDDFLSCNPNLISCWIKGEIGSQFKFFEILGGVNILKDRSISFEFKDLYRNQIYSLKLNYNCHKTLLPTRVFSATSSRDKGELWDNFNRKIFIDKFYVSQYEVDLGKRKLPKISKQSLSPYLVQNLDEMKNICHSFSGKLLPAHIFDALTYFPSKVENSYQFKSHVPWDKTFNLKNLNSHSKKLCKNVLTLECHNEKIHNYQRLSPSWAGAFNMLGGEVEVLDNYFESMKNLKISSRYFPYHSEVHENSFRSFWNGSWGNQLKLSYQKLKDLVEIEKIKGFAFRCVYN